MLRLATFSSILLIAGAVGACAHSTASDRGLRASRQGQLREIAERCGLPARALWLNRAGHVRLRPSPDTRYEIVDCVLVKLREGGFADRMPMGFVGNEAPAEEVGNDAPPN